MKVYNYNSIHTSNPIMHAGLGHVEKKSLFIIASPPLLIFEPKLLFTGHVHGVL